LAADHQGLELAASAVAMAQKAGADEAEATSSVAERFSTEARGAEIVKLEQSTGRALSLRVFVDGGRKATLSTTDFSRDGMESLVRRVVDAARYVAEDRCAGLPETPAAADGGDLAADLEIYFDDVRARDPDEKMADVRTMEAQTRAYDPRIVNSNGSRLSDAVVTLALVNSRGFRGSYRATNASRGASPVAHDGPNKRTASYGSASRSYTMLEGAESIARTAARRVMEMFGARKPATMRVPVIFERDVAASVLSDLFSALTGANVAIGNSYFADRIGEKIGSDLVTIVDDGRLPQGLGTSPFDAEGTPTRKTVVFERGTLRTFLFDTYYARRLGASTTGNAAGGGIGPNNFYLEPGAESLEQLIAATPRGILVLDTIGFATEYASGTYSRGARGIMIENGAPAYPIEEFTIASNLRQMLAGIDRIANDLRFDGTVVAPSFRVAEMTVSGN
jgi:PmbA protein